MEEMGLLGPFLVQLGAPMKWAGLEMPKLVAAHQRVKGQVFRVCMTDYIVAGEGTNIKCLLYIYYDYHLGS